MAGFVLNKIHFGNTPLSQQNITIQYKLWSDPEGSYVTIGTELVDVDGDILASPLPIVTGLVSGQVYYIRSFNVCASPVEYFLTALTAQ